jgi:hypothetical protein
VADGLQSYQSETAELKSQNKKFPGKIGQDFR